MVLPSETHNSTVPIDTGYERYLKEQSREWLAEASESLDDDDDVDVAQSLHVRYAESFAEGLIAAAHEFGASLIVVGAARGGMLGRSRIGSVANELLHSSDVPGRTRPGRLPRGARRAGRLPHHRRDRHAPRRGRAARGIRSPRPNHARAAAAALARARSTCPPASTRISRRSQARCTPTRCSRAARRELPASLDATAVAATGATIEEAVQGLDWHAGEIVLVGSSRLATPHHLFLGSTAAKMLRELPVPMIVVPRTTT